MQRHLGRLNSRERQTPDRCVENLESFSAWKQLRGEASLSSTGILHRDAEKLAKFLMIEYTSRIYLDLEGL